MYIILIYLFYKEKAVSSSWPIYFRQPDKLAYYTHLNIREVDEKFLNQEAHFQTC